MKTVKKFFLATGQILNRQGGGVRCFVVPEGTTDSSLLREKFCFRQKCLDPGRFYWSGEIEFSSVEVTLHHSISSGAEMSGLATVGYEYIVASVESFGGASQYETAAILAWVCDNQAACNAGLSLADVKSASQIINLTQHEATAEQSAAGVVEPDDKSAVQALITFNTLPSTDDVLSAAAAVADFAVQSGCKKAMIGGAPFFMAPLEAALRSAGIIPLYAFTVRDSVERDGIKTSVFHHAGFIEGVVIFN